MDRLDRSGTGKASRDLRGNGPINRVCGRTESLMDAMDDGLLESRNPRKEGRRERKGSNGMKEGDGAVAEARPYLLATVAVAELWSAAHIRSVLSRTMYAARRPASITKILQCHRRCPRHEIQSCRQINKKICMVRMHQGVPAE